MVLLPLIILSFSLWSCQVRELVNEHVAWKLGLTHLQVPHHTASTVFPCDCVALFPYRCLSLS